MTRWTCWLAHAGLAMALVACSQRDTARQTEVVAACGGDGEVCCAGASPCATSGQRCRLDNRCGACGADGQACCADAPCEGQGKDCSGNGTCGICGGTGEPCCFHGPFCRIAGDGCTKQHTCEPCGGKGEKCCSGDAACADGLRCADALICESDCGGAGEACCAGGSRCEAGLGCAFGVCGECGGADQRCCFGGSNDGCKPGLYCEYAELAAAQPTEAILATYEQADQAVRCRPCGAAQQPCCRADDGTLSCAAGLACKEQRDPQNDVSPPRCLP